jgi:hypothetical protein
MNFSSLAEILSAKGGHTLHEAIHDEAWVRRLEKFKGGCHLLDSGFIWKSLVQFHKKLGKHVIKRSDRRHFLIRRVKSLSLERFTGDSLSLTKTIRDNEVDEDRIEGSWLGVFIEFQFTLVIELGLHMNVTSSQWPRQ